MAHVQAQAAQARLIEAMKPVAVRLRALWVHPGVKAEHRIAEKQQRKKRHAELTDIVRGSLVLRDAQRMDEAESLLRERAGSRTSRSKLTQYFTLLESGHPAIHAQKYVRKVLLRDRDSRLIAEIQLHTCESFWLTHIATHGPYEVRRQLSPHHACRPLLLAAEKISLAPHDPMCLRALKSLVDKDGLLLLGQGAASAGGSWRRPQTPY